MAVVLLTSNLFARVHISWLLSYLLKYSHLFFRLPFLALFLVVLSLFDILVTLVKHIFVCFLALTLPLWTVLVKLCAI